jgi:glycosyltransferase involved in cell wall biosynthesis
MLKNLCFSSAQYSKKAIIVLREQFPGQIFETQDSMQLREQGILSLIRSFRSCGIAVFFTYDLKITGQSPLWIIILSWLSRHGAYMVDTYGKILRVGWGSLFFRSLPALLPRLVSLPFEFIIGKNKIHKLESGLAEHHPSPVGKIGEAMNLSYLRTDHYFGTKAGGSVGHIAGVVNGFTERNTRVFIISTDTLELIDTRKTPLFVVKPEPRFNFVTEVPELYFNRQLLKTAGQIFQKEKPDLIYQRYSLNNYTGVALAGKFNLPFILEFNGSEVWVARNWGRRLRFEKLSLRIEFLNFRAADLIVVVSQPLKDELIGRGIAAEKILVNPNGVDPQRYRPDIDGGRVRRLYGLEGKTIVGFIGTFGNWHGAEVLAAAAVKLVNELGVAPDIRFLFIGDGVKLPLTRQIITEGKITERAVFTGMVPQEQGPEYLAACDILVAPHVPNPDGSAFFGSPTKLFEYMAMGKGIVASNLDQIGEVLENGKTAWMTEPGNAANLAEGILALISDKTLREQLGKNARAEVLANYTWKQHVAKTVDKLAEVLKR